MYIETREGKRGIYMYMHEKDEKRQRENRNNRTGRRKDGTIQCVIHTHMTRPRGETHGKGKW